MPIKPAPLVAEAHSADDKCLQRKNNNSRCNEQQTAVATDKQTAVATDVRFAALGYCAGQDFAGGSKTVHELCSPQCAIIRTSFRVSGYWSSALARQY
jgi:hypothetical protein